MRRFLGHINFFKNPTFQKTEKLLVSVSKMSDKVCFVFNRNEILVGVNTYEIIIFALQQ